jgi:hypothetical protein
LEFGGWGGNGGKEERYLPFLVEVSRDRYRMLAVSGITKLISCTFKLQVPTTFQCLQTSELKQN